MQAPDQSTQASFVKTLVDLTAIPTHMPIGAPHTTFAHGDTHSNVLRLLTELISCGILRLKEAANHDDISTRALYNQVICNYYTHNFRVALLKKESYAELYLDKSLRRQFRIMKKWVTHLYDEVATSDAANIPENILMLKEEIIASDILFIEPNDSDSEDDEYDEINDKLADPNEISQMQAEIRASIKNDIENFSLLVQRLELGNHAEECSSIIIGDELADRGRYSDYAMLQLLQRLVELNYTFEINYSNHTDVFFQNMRAHFGQTPLDNPSKIGGKTSNQQSLNTLFTLIEQDIVDKETVQQIVANVYHSRLTLFSYRLSEDGKNITLYSHAPVGLETLSGLADEYRIDFHYNTAAEIANSIDKINEAFRGSLQDDSLYQTHLRADWLGIGVISSAHNPILRVLWQRGRRKAQKQSGHQPGISYIQRLDPTAITAASMPQTIESGDELYTLTWVHGHDGPNEPATEPGASYLANMINLDTLLGKYLISGKTVGTQGNLLVHHHCGAPAPADTLASHEIPRAGP